MITNNMNSPVRNNQNFGGLCEITEPTQRVISNMAGSQEIKTTLARLQKCTSPYYRTSNNRKRWRRGNNRCITSVPI